MSEPAWIQETEDFLRDNLTTTLSVDLIMRDIRELNARAQPTTKRELFAAMAMQGFLAGRNQRLVMTDVPTLCESSVTIADTLLSALNESEGP